MNNTDSKIAEKSRAKEKNITIQNIKIGSAEIKSITNILGV